MKKIITDLSKSELHFAYTDYIYIYLFIYFIFVTDIVNTLAVDFIYIQYYIN